MDNHEGQRAPILPYAVAVTPVRLLIAVALLPVVTLLAGPAQAAQAADRWVSPQVVNGREPVAGELRGLVYVRIGSTACSGTLVDELHVITAAHCTTSSTGAKVLPSRVQVGWSPTIYRSDLMMHPVVAVDVDPDYDPKTFVNDISVVTLAAPIPGATPMRVTSETASRTALTAGSSVRSAGYGYTSVQGTSSDRALVADLTVLPNTVCSQEDKTIVIGGVTFSGLGVDTATAVCAIGVRPDTQLLIDTCQGDSGGPLFTGSGTSERLVGLVSVGVGCAGFDWVDGRVEELAQKTPGVYTKIAPFLPWLAEIGVDVRPTEPSAPVVTAARAGSDGIAVTFVPQGAVPSRSYRALATSATDPTDIGSCTSSLRQAACTMTGLTPGSTYAVVGYSLGATEESPASASVSVEVGGPSAAPVKPRITDSSPTPARRIAVRVTTPDDPRWTRTVVICKDGPDTFRGDVVNGRAVLTLPRQREFLCYAKSTNELGSVRSKRVPVTVR